MPYKTKRARNEIVAYHEQGLNITQIATKLGISTSTVHRWLMRHAADLTLETVPKPGRPRKTTKETDVLIRDKIREEGFKSANEIKSELNLDHLHPDTIRNRFKEFGLKYRSVAVTPMLTPNHKEKRLAFAIKYRHWASEDWHKVVFSDEKIFRGDGYIGNKIWRSNDLPRYDSQHVKRQNRQSKHKINVWACISWHGGADFIHRITRETLNTEYYIENILSEYIPEGDETFVFMHDRATIHFSKNTVKFLANRNVKVLDWPPKGADINPIENVWAEVERKTKYRHAANADELWIEISRAFRELGYEYVQKLIDSMPRRLEAVIKANGDWTKY